MPHFEFRTIDELLDDNCNYNRKQEEFLLDELTQCDKENENAAYIEVEGIVYDIIKHLGKYFGGYRHKHGSKKSYKCKECTISNALAGLEKILQEYVIQIEKLQAQLLKCPGKKVGTVVSAEGILAKSSIGKSDGFTGLTGGAVGGAGGGLAAGLKNIEKMGGFESQGKEKELGQGAIGGAAGGALGSVGIPTTGALSSPGGIATTGRDAIGLEDATEITYDIERESFNSEK